MGDGPSNGGRHGETGRFLKGQSGNRLGRPRKPKSVGAAITGAFAEKVPINEGGRRRRITKLEAAAKQVANKSASGDTKSIKLGLELARKAEEQQSRSFAGPAQLSETDQQIAARFVARIQKILKEKDDGHDPDPTEAG